MRVVTVECRRNLCIVIAERSESYVVRDGAKTIIVLGLDADCSTVFHELLHAAGVDDEVDAQALEGLLASFYCGRRTG